MPVIFDTSPEWALPGLSFDGILYPMKENTRVGFSSSMLAFRIWDPWITLACHNGGTDPSYG